MDVCEHIHKYILNNKHTYMHDGYILRCFRFALVCTNKSHHLQNDCVANGVGLTIMRILRKFSSTEHNT